MDRGLFQSINSGPPWLAPSMRFFSVGINQGPMKALLVVVVIAMLAAGRVTRRAILLALLSIPLADGFVHIVKTVWPALRPCNDPTMIVLDWGVGWANTSGTASSHAANMAAVAVIMVAHLRWFGAPWVLMALLVGYSRVFCGVHYPYQVALGWTIGVAFALAVLAIVRRIEQAVWKRREGRSDAAEPTPAPAA